MMEADPLRYRKLQATCLINGKSLPKISMGTHSIIKHFNKMGATLKIKKWQPRNRWEERRPPADFYTLDVVEDKNEHYLITYKGPMPEFTLLEVDKKRRHLLMMAKSAYTPIGGNWKEKFLCGHDERHWFAATVSRGGVTNITTAMESLKPNLVRNLEVVKKVKRKNRNRRKNAAFLRQGEWFFIPRPDFEPNRPDFVLYREPITRGGGGKPHVIEWLYRTGGETVYVNRRFPSGLTEKQLKDRMRTDKSLRPQDFRVMRRNMRVFAKGTVRHADHYTLELQGWHEVVMNQESRSANLAFLD